VLIIGLGFGVRDLLGNTRRAGRTLIILRAIIWWKEDPNRGNGYFALVHHVDLIDERLKD